MGKVTAELWQHPVTACARSAHAIHPARRRTWTAFAGRPHFPSPDGDDGNGLSTGDGWFSPDRP
jgi:hypothetical protein